MEFQALIETIRANVTEMDDDEHECFFADLVEEFGENIRAAMAGGVDNEDV